MTAEVVVMNKSAIALAADSKVTVSGARMSKTYDTVNKLFTLSKVHPVGIMIYGSADFMSFPWETIIKLYRKQKRGENEERVADWATDFSKFLKSFGNVSAKDKIENTTEFVRSWYSSILDEADDIAISRAISIGSDEYIKLLKNIISEKIVFVTDKDLWLPEKRMKGFVDNYGSKVDETTKDYFEDFNDGELTKLADQFISCAIFYKYPSPTSSGIVIAGFGENELFPTVVSLECDGYVGSELKLYVESVVDISRNMPGAMRAFAQGEMVQRFMTGLDPAFGTALMTAFGELLEKNCLEVLERYGTKANKAAKNIRAIEDAVVASMNDLVGNVHKYTSRVYSDPIVQMVSLLPKDELANLAESLVALTSLKRRVSSEIETVGGAIDVAIISKSDGFIWIKRKYSFSEDLNPQFNLNYLNDILKGNINEASKSKAMRRRTSGNVSAAGNPKKVKAKVAAKGKSNARRV